MRNGRTVYLLDPHALTFQAIELPNLETNTLAELLGYEAIDTLRIDDEHILYFNDGGVRRGICHFIQIAGQPDPFVGKIVIASADKAQRHPAMSLAAAYSLFEINRPVIDPIVKSTRASNGDHTTFISVVERFDTRLEKFHIDLISEPVLGEPAET